MKTKFGTVVASIGARNAIEYGVLSEKLGFDSIWITDHLIDDGGIKIEPWTTFGSISALTKKIMMCSAVTDSLRMHPARIAHTIVTLDEISSGRVSLGIGAGEAMNLIPFGIPFEKPEERAERLREAIQVIRLLWKSNRRSPVSFNGDFYRLQNAWLDSSLRSTRLPAIYVGALGGKRALEIAGSFGDGWLPWLNNPETYRKRLETVRKAARSSGRDPKEIDAALYLYTCLTDNERDKRRAVSHTKRALLVEAHTLKLLGIDHPSILGQPYQSMLVNDEMAGAISDLEQIVPDGIALQCMAAGSASEIIETIEGFRRVGATHIIIQLLPQNKENLEQFGKQVLSHFKE